MSDRRGCHVLRTHAGRADFSDLLKHANYDETLSPTEEYIQEDGPDS
jgi:hypothetical protein